jgi:acyl carrier protein
MDRHPGCSADNDPSGRLKLQSVAFTQAPVWGLSHVIAEEHPEFHCTRLDLDPQSSAVNQTQGLLSEILYPEVEEDQIAFRDQHRKLRRVVRIVDNDGSYASIVPIRADASYLITGGLGGLGLSVAGWLVAKGARNLMLMGRSAPSLQAQEAIRQMEAQDVQVVILRGDISQPEALASFLEAAGTTTPALRGIIHAAGTLDDGVLLHQTWERFQTVMASKISGSWNLHRATRDIPLDFCVYFSSGASVLGSPGQGNYAAANAFMDALAHHRSAIGLPSISINWGAWSAVGMAAQQKEIISSKRGSLTPQEGLQALEWGIRTYPHSYLPLHIQLIVMKVNWSGYFRQLMPGQAPALLEAFWKEADQMVPAITQGGEDAHNTPNLLEALATIPPKKRFSTLVTQIRGQATLVLGIDPKKNIDLDLPLHEFGLDSLMAVELRNKLSRLVGQPLPATLLFEFPTVRTLAGRLETILFQTLASPEVEQEKPITPPLIEQAPGTTDLDQMTEEELAALLIKKINTISRSLE